MNWVLDLVFGRNLQTQTRTYLRSLRTASEVQLRNNANDAIAKLTSGSAATTSLGTTSWGEPICIPLELLLKAHGLITGGTGAGKTSFALLLLRALICSSAEVGSFGLVDPKGDLFVGCLWLIAKRLEELAKSDPHAARGLRRRIVIYDFSLNDPVSSYNILARWKGVDPDFFASNRAELLLDLLAGSDSVSLAGSAVLQKLLLLLSESDLPITCAEDALADPAMLENLVAKSKDSALTNYFTRQFTTTPKPTVLALRRRISALFASESVRLSLAGTTAPDFRKFQDEGKIVLVNCFGPSISRGVRRVLQNLVVSDIRQAVFTRQRKEYPFLWLMDEAQNFFINDNLRESISDLLTMSRSFGTHCLFLTQNMSTAVPDTRMLKALYTNIRWSFSMRGEPTDCAFLKPVLPITGQRPRLRTSPFEAATYYTVSEERSLVMDEVANLPDRTGYLWLRSKTPEALRMTTGDLAMPSGRDLEAATASVRRDPNIGGRIPRKVYDRLTAVRDRQGSASVREESGGPFGETLAAAYKDSRKSRDAV